MEQTYFQEAILEQVRSLLSDGTPLSRLQEIARQALRVSEAPQIPNEKVLLFLERYPEVSGQLRVTLESEEQDTRSAVIEQVRALINHRAE